MLKSDDTDFVQYCLDNYKTPYFSQSEFSNDLNKTVVLKKMFRRYLDKGIINERLVLNNIIMLINVFGVEAANVILFFKLDTEFYPLAKTILIYLNCYKENELTKHIEADVKMKVLLDAM